MRSILPRRGTEWKMVRSERGGQRPLHAGPGTHVRIFGFFLEGDRNLWKSVDQRKDMFGYAFSQPTLSFLGALCWSWIAICFSYR